MLVCILRCKLGEDKFFVAVKSYLKMVGKCFLKEEFELKYFFVRILDEMLFFIVAQKQSNNVWKYFQILILDKERQDLCSGKEIENRENANKAIALGILLKFLLKMSLTNDSFEYDFRHQSFNIIGPFQQSPHFVRQ